jgi:hypothetical protein
MWKTVRESGVTYKGFSWHSEVTDHVKKAQALFAEQRHARQTAILWEQCQMLPDGQFLTWKKPAAYAGGYTWFYRILVKLPKTDKEACSWFVVGHPNEYDPRLVEAARLAATSGEDTIPTGDEVAPPIANADADHSEQVTMVPATLRLPQYAGQVPIQEATGQLDATGDEAKAIAPYRDPCVALSIIRRQKLLADNSSRYEMCERLGAGSFGIIFRATRGTSDVAVKKMRTSGWHAALEETYVVERGRNHPNIIQLFDAFSTQEAGTLKAHLVYELWGTDLGAHVAENGHLPPQDIRTAIAQVCSALRFLHCEVEMMHTDVKSSNVLVARCTEATRQTLRFKLADFGSCVEALWSNMAYLFCKPQVARMYCWRVVDKSLSKA